MATPRASTGAGSALYIDASPDVRIAQIKTLKINGMDQAMEKVTNMDSDINANNQIFQEVIGTIVDPGTIDLTLNWVPSDISQQQLLSYFDNQVHSWKIYGPIVIGSSPQIRKFVWRFDATMFKSPDIDLTVDKAMELVTKLQLIGEPDAFRYDVPVGSE